MTREGFTLKDTLLIWCRKNDLEAYYNTLRYEQRITSPDEFLEVSEEEIVKLCNQLQCNQLPMPFGDKSRFMKAIKMYKEEKDQEKAKEKESLALYHQQRMIDAMKTDQNDYHNEPSQESKMEPNPQQAQRGSFKKHRGPKKNNQQQQQIICPYFAKGNCKYGNRCLYIHDAFGGKFSPHPPNLPQNIESIQSRMDNGCITTEISSQTQTQTTRRDSYKRPRPKSTEKNQEKNDKRGAENKRNYTPNNPKQDCAIKPKKDCPMGIQCKRYRCRLQHPAERNLCRKGSRCRDFACNRSHPRGRKPKCKKAADCYRHRCPLLHPSTRKLCKMTCDDYACTKTHPPKRIALCSRGVNCDNGECPLLHPKDRNIPCEEGESCSKFDCKKNHPVGRTQLCIHGKKCWNMKCELLHPDDWEVCELGENCMNPDCKGSHPNSRKIKSNVTVEEGKKKADEMSRVEWEKKKRKEEMNKFKEQLPIHKKHEEFCERLYKEKVLVVRAETGSGKTTQLPQYAANKPEYFPKLIVCTQPRVMAAISIARRVASEYDGASVGESVGYRVGGGNKIKGTKIMFMTDSSLVRLAQDDPNLSEISVLIIDEAHERSLYTDVVIGIAKLVRNKRLSDFHVVISSATIEPKPFLNFYEISANPLEVLGKPYPVHLEYHPPTVARKIAYVDIDYIIEKLFEAMETVTRGHTLVFLPGQSEIEMCLKRFLKRAPRNYIGVPLYGSLPPEEQEKVLRFDDNNGQLRMVVFCTNVAETSLTVPKVNLVIDSGFAKEARFDARRRINVIELTRISRASADQRKGRAGRTEPGRCIRLYKDEELIRLSIEPEILRSSLDMIILTLRCLNLNPLTFPFMDQPNQKVIESSLALLKKFGCLTGEDWKVTKEGKIFSRLPFDPRLSAFVFKCMEYDKLELAAEIASIVSAPGQIFYMGSDKKRQSQVKRNIAHCALSHNSDLLYLHSIYTEWKDAGKCENGRCVQCRKIIGKKIGDTKGCRNCKVSHSNRKSLNNKILECVQQNTRVVLKEIRNSIKPKFNDQKNTLNNEEIISIALKQCFPEQIGKLLLEHNPQAGVKLFSENIRGKLAITSALVQKKKESGSSSANLFVALSIVCLTNGCHLFDRVHPLQDHLLQDEEKKYMDESEKIEEIYTQSNLGKKIFNEVQLYQEEHWDTSEWAKWSTLEYDVHKTMLTIYGPNKFKTDIRKNFSQSIEGVKKSVLEKTIAEVMGMGTIFVKFGSGLALKELLMIKSAQKIAIKSPDTIDAIEFRKTLTLRNNIKENTIKGCCILNDGSRAIVIFDTEENARMAVRQLTSNQIKVEYRTEESKYGIENKEEDEDEDDDEDESDEDDEDDEDDESKDSDVSSNSQSTTSTALSFERDLERKKRERYDYGKKLKITISGDPDVQNISQKFKNIGVTVKKISKIRSQQPTYRAFLINCPTNLTMETVKQDLIDIPDRLSCRVFPSQSEGGTSRLSLQYTKEGSRDQAVEKCLLLYKKHPIKLKSGNMGTANCKCKEKSNDVSKTVFAVILNSTKDAEKVYKECIDNLQWEVVSQASVKVSYPYLYEMNQIITNIQDRTGAKIVAQHHKRHQHMSGGRHKRRGHENERPNFQTYFVDGEPKSVLWAVQLLRTVTTPTSLPLTDPKMRLMFDELRTLKKFDEWKQLQVKYFSNKPFGHEQRQTKKPPRNPVVAIYGPQVEIGKFMLFIAEYSEKFSQRYKLIPMNPGSCGLFRDHMAGDSALKNLAESIKHIGTVRFDRQQSGIEVYIKSDLNQEKLYTKSIEIVEELAKVMFAKLGITSADFLSDPQSCGYCNQKTELHSFVLCGHHYCNSCLINKCKDKSNANSITCGRCSSEIAIDDFIKISKDKAVSERKQFIFSNYLKQTPNLDIMLCLNQPDCQAILKKEKAYIQCFACRKHMCTFCEVMETDEHKGVECDIFQKSSRIGNEVIQMIEKAKKWARENWPPDIPAIQEIYPNESLLAEENCPAYLRFIKGVEKIIGNSPLSETNSFFSWHGTNKIAIAPICDGGFDTNRRSGQVHGPGEYFGWTASTSRGYCRGSTHMLVTLILRGPFVKSVDGFCYVVANPTHQEYSYCLPLLVIDFGKPPSFPTFIKNPLLRTRNKSSLIPEDSKWTEPFRWFWEDDRRKYQPYKDEDNSKLEKGYEEWKRGIGGHIVRLSTLIRLLDDKPQDYIVDLKELTQKNTLTSYSRKIKREKLFILSSGSIKWFYMNDFGVWTRYDSIMEGTLEQHYQSYCNGIGNSTFQDYFPGRPEKYSIDFSIGTQTNLTTNKVRNTRRVVSK